MRGGPSLKVQGRTGGFSKDPSLMGKSGANERNESSLSNCRVQPALSKKEGRVDFRKNLRLREDWLVFEKLLIPLHHVLSLFLPGKLHLPFLAILRKELQ